jgi:hypothetical protein
MEELVYQSTPTVRFASNTFINVPTILQFDDTPLISVVRGESLGFTTEIPIYHSDGTYLAKVRGTRVYPTKEGEKAGVEVRRLPLLWVCTIGGRTAFEIHQEPGDAFRAHAELHTPNGYFVKVAGEPTAELYRASGEALAVGSITMTGNVFQNLRIGVLLRSNGSIMVGVA